MKELRSARGWTQEQLAQAAGVSRQSINAIERERYVPSLELALIFARIWAKRALREGGEAIDRKPGEPLNR